MQKQKTGLLDAAASELGCPVSLGGKPVSYRLIYTYHKTGTHLFSTSKKTINPILDAALNDASVLPLPSAAAGSELAAQAAICKARTLASWSWSGNPYGCFAARHCRQALPKRRSVQLVRDPFAQIASSYLYHRGTAEEPWTVWPLDEDPGKRRDARGWMMLYWSVRIVFHPTDVAWIARPPLSMEVLTQVFLNEWRNVERYSASALPWPYLTGETYSQYLKRVPPKEGLFAEAQRMARYDFVLMRHDMRTAGNAIQVCVEALGDSRRAVCRGAWGRMLTHQGYPPPLEARLFEALVNATCPSESGQLAAGHVRVSRASQKADGLDAGALRRLVHQLDAERFRGEIVQLARLWNCSRPCETESNRGEPPPHLAPRIG